MRVCGIELKGGEAILCILEHDNGVFIVPKCRQSSFAVSESSTTDSIRAFHAAFIQLMGDYKVDHVAIIERDQKGKWAGSATSFKLEAAIQLVDMPVQLISPTSIKEQIQRNRLAISFESLELKKFQKRAFEAAYAYQNKLIYGTE
jgi:hypothetical protein